MLFRCDFEHGLGGTAVGSPRTAEIAFQACSLNDSADYRKLPSGRTSGPAPLADHGTSSPYGWRNVWAGAFPYGTLIVNLLGCYARGFGALLVTDRSLGYHEWLHPCPYHLFKFYYETTRLFEGGALVAAGADAERTPEQCAYSTAINSSCGSSSATRTNGTTLVSREHCSTVCG